MGRTSFSQGNFFCSLILCAALMGLTSCASFTGAITGHKCDAETLGKSLDTFLSAVRWEDYKAASAFLAPSIRRQFWEDMDLFQKRVRIMDFQVRDAAPQPGMLSADVIVQCRFYHTNDPQLHTMTLQQQWRCLEKEKVWLVMRHDLEKLILVNLPQ